MIRMSMLRNCPVVCQERQIGLLQSVGLDSAQKTVQSLIVAGGMKGKQVVFSNQILALTREFILVSDAVKYRRTHEPRHIRFVRDMTGLLFGRVTDFMIDEKTLNAAAFEVMQGYLTREQRARIWLFSWTVCRQCEDELVAPDTFSGEPSDDL